MYICNIGDGEGQVITWHRPADVTTLGDVAQLSDVAFRLNFRKIRGEESRATHSMTSSCFLCFFTLTSLHTRRSKK